MDRLDELTFRLLDARLSAEEARELDVLLATDAQASERFAAQLRLEAVLRGEGPVPDVAATTVETVRSTAEDDLERAVMRTIAELPAPPWSQSSDASEWSERPRRRVRRVAVYVAAASLLLAAAVGYWGRGWRGAGDSHLPQVAAADAGVELLSTDGRATFATAGVRIAAGDKLVVPDDDQIRLVYADGTTVELFGPSQLIVSAGPDGGKRLQLVQGGMELDVRPQPPGRPMIVVTPEGEVQVLGTKFRLTTGGERTRIEMEEGKVAFLHGTDGRRIEVGEGAFIVAGRGDSHVAVEPLPPTLSAPLWSRRKTGFALAMSSDGARLAVAGRHGGLMLLDVPTGATLADWSTDKESSDPTKRATRYGFAPDDRGLYAVDPSGELTLWNLDDGRQATVALPGDVGVLRAFGDSGRLFGHTLGRGYQRELQLLDLGEPTGPRPLHVWRSREDLWGAAISPAGKFAAIGSRTGKLHLFDVASGKELRQVQAAAGAIMHPVISADDRYLAYHTAQEGICVVTLPELTDVDSWMPEGPGVASLAFTPDGRTLAAGLADRTVRFWSLADRRPILLIKLQGDRARQLAFSPDGSLLATGGNDAAVWRLPWKE